MILRDLFGPSVTVHNGDCLDVMTTIPSNSVDAVVTDPPYHLTTAGRYGGKDAAPAQYGTDGAFRRASRGFMGKEWDGGDIAFRTETWAHVLRILKPGGHLLAFSGSRTYHRMVVAIEDAGFEIRDQIMWVYATGFPKSHNVDNNRGDLICGCEGGTHPYDQSPSERSLRPVPQTDVSATLNFETQRRQILHSLLPQQSPPAHRNTYGIGQNEGSEQSGMEGWSDLPDSQRQLRIGEIREVSDPSFTDGTQRRLHNGASTSDGRLGRSFVDSAGSGAPPRPRSAKQRSVKSGIMADQQGSQTSRAWPVCAGCGKPMVQRGLGSALKPAHEPIVMARKPLIGTIVENVLAHGTGAINIDGCRVATDEDRRRNARGGDNGLSGTGTFKIRERKVDDQPVTAGRWPANLLHDGSDEVVSCFPGEAGARAPVTVRNGDKFRNTYGAFAGNIDEQGSTFRGDSGSAARFFYAAKASSADRAGSKHPTVKPVALMRYLVRMVTPPGGTVLDPFAGSGTTLQAARLEQFDSIGIEREVEYYADICKRLAL